MTRGQKADVYSRILKDQGFTPTLDPDGDIEFKYEGGHYLILLDDDEVFFRLMFPIFWPIEDEPERARAVEAALHATAQTKVAKVFIIGDAACASIEMFVGSPDAVDAVFMRCLGALQASVAMFRKRMLEGVPA